MPWASDLVEDAGLEFNVGTLVAEILNNSTFHSR